MKKITNNTKGEKMRKFILPILVAGAVAFTASQAFAEANTHYGSFQEDHATANTITTSTTPVVNTDLTPVGDHYKITNATEAGAHGRSWQLDSALLKNMANGIYDGDTSWGYTTGANPFVEGNALITQPDPFNSDTIMVAPAYTLPCPEFVTSGPGLGTCGANINADDPQTELAVDIWDGTVLDDLYQVVGVNDSTAGTDYNRILDQTLDQLFYSGKRGKVQYDANGNGLYTGAGEEFTNGKITGSTNIGGTGRIFNIDDTLDQDLADYNTNGTSVVGIFNKLTMNFQLAGKQLEAAEMNAMGFTTVGTGFGTDQEAGCSSWGGGHGGGETTCIALNGGEELGGTTFYDIMQDSAEAADIWNSATNAHKNFAAVLIEQWLDAEVYDWNTVSGDPKVQGLGMKQELSTYFRDGAGKHYNYIVDIGTGHGNEPNDGGINVTSPTHGTIDP